ncbi:MAG: glutamate racemase [Cyclobacteriaceae bacterium]
MVTNQQITATSPIGIFDSGIGGLTVAKEIQQILPHEQLIYFGDTVHLPYGDKSTSAIQAYAIKICNLLLEHSCKVIVIACNSASAAAYELVKEYVGSRAKVINVIDPTVEHIMSSTEVNASVGVIGTRRTIETSIYKQKLSDHTRYVNELATPLLAPMIEEGFYEHKISYSIIEQYLSDERFTAIKQLVLGCTHYPLIKEEISNYFKGKVEIIDSAEYVALSVKKYLSNASLLSKERKEEHTFFVSDFTNSFDASTSLFFSEKVELQLYKLWE